MPGTLKTREAACFFRTRKYAARLCEKTALDDAPALAVGFASIEAWLQRRRGARSPPWGRFAFTERQYGSCVCEE